MLCDYISHGFAGPFLLGFVVGIIFTLVAIFFCFRSKNNDTSDT